MEEKKKFLLNSSLLYQELIKQTPNDCIRRFLAFRIIVNTMSYEDLIRNRTFARMRQIRDIFLAHKQEGDFFEGFNAGEEIRDRTIQPLLDFMMANIADTGNYLTYPELIDEPKKNTLARMAALILDKFEEEFYKGFRVSNNFLCNAEGQIKEISSNPIASVFYRYNSTKELSILANFFITHVYKWNEFEMADVNFCIDYILHAVNMHDCIFKDTFNRHSINGLYEVLKNENIGDITPLDNLKADSSYTSIYSELRKIRNKIAGHIDTALPLVDLINMVKNFDMNKAFEFVNKLEMAVFGVSRSHIAIKVHTMNTTPIVGPEIIEVKGFKNLDYYS